MALASEEREGYLDSVVFIAADGSEMVKAQLGMTLGLVGEVKSFAHVRYRFIPERVRDVLAGEHSRGLVHGVQRSYLRAVVSVHQTCMSTLSR